MSHDETARTAHVGPDHARQPARLRIMESGAPTHLLSQRRLAGGYRLFLAVPRAVAPRGGWPILYMLDGNAAFDYLTPAHLKLAAGLVIAGIGYDTDRQFARERRVADFTPPDQPGAGLRPDHVDPKRMAGGAQTFLDLLTGELRHQTEDQLPIDPLRRTLWGHSLGGLFTLYALLTRPAEFARHAAISPSIWWDETLMRGFATAARQASMPLLVALGDREKRSGTTGPPPDGPPPVTMRFIADLARHPGHRANVHVLPGHVHIQTLEASFPLTFRFAAR